MVSKPMGISHVSAIRHFKQSMGGVDRVYQNVGKCICRIGSKNVWWPLLLYFIDIYIMCNIRHICVVPCHRERIVPNTCQLPGERSPRYCTRRLPQSRQYQTEARICRAIAKHQSWLSRTLIILIEPTDNLRSEQDVHVVAGNARNAS